MDAAITKSRRRFFICFLAELPGLHRGEDKENQPVPTGPESEDRRDDRRTKSDLWAVIHPLEMRSRRYRSGLKNQMISRVVNQASNSFGDKRLHNKYSENISRSWMSFNMPC